jgi:hypothetical protein
MRRVGSSWSSTGSLYYCFGRRKTIEAEKKKEEYSCPPSFSESFTAHRWVSSLLRAARSNPNFHNTDVSTWLGLPRSYTSLSQSKMNQKYFKSSFASIKQGKGVNVRPNITQTKHRGPSPTHLLPPHSQSTSSKKEEEEEEEEEKVSSCCESFNGDPFRRANCSCDDYTIITRLCVPDAFLRIGSARTCLIHYHSRTIKTCLTKTCKVVDQSIQFRVTISFPRIYCVLLFYNALVRTIYCITFGRFLLGWWLLAYNNSNPFSKVTLTRALSARAVMC